MGSSGSTLVPRTLSRSASGASHVPSLFAIVLVERKCAHVLVLVSKQTAGWITRILRGCRAPSASDRARCLAAAGQDQGSSSETQTARAPDARGRSDCKDQIDFACQNAPAFRCGARAGSLRCPRLHYERKAAGRMSLPPRRRGCTRICLCGDRTSRYLHHRIHACRRCRERSWAMLAASADPMLPREPAYHQRNSRSPQ
jgi:hypothetical protein